MAFGDRMKTFEDSEKESEYGYVRKVSGPVVVADGMGGAAMHLDLWLWLMEWVVLSCMNLFALVMTTSLVKLFVLTKSREVLQRLEESIRSTAQQMQDEGMGDS